MKTFWLNSVLVLFLFTNCKSEGENGNKPIYFVKEGKAVNIIDESDLWQTKNDGFTVEGQKGFLHAGVVIGTGDFEIFAQLKLDDIQKNNASFFIDLAKNIDSSEFIFARNGNLVVRGFFFGNRTQTVMPLNGLIKSNEWFQFSVKRIDDMVTFFVSEEPVWRMKYESDRPFGKISFQPGEGRLTVHEFLMRGSTIPLDDWIPFLEREYPVNGDKTTDVFTGGSDGYHTYRIPAIVKTNSGILLAFAEGRKNNHLDHGDVDLVLRRSFDGGQTWQPMQLVYEEGETALTTIGNPVPVVDRITNRIWLFFCRDNRNVLATFSNDEGVTWAAPQDLTAQLKKDSWAEWYATGPCHGIQMENGRLIVPANHGLINEKGSRPHMIISDDHGTTWQIGGIPVDALANENTVADLGNNELYLNMRSSDHNNSKPYCRKVTWSNDGGSSFDKTLLDSTLVSPICQGSVLNFKFLDGQNLLLFSNPASWRRERMTIRTSSDNGKTWTNNFLIYEGSSAYSDLVQVDEKTAGLLFERDTYGKISFVRFNPRNIVE